MGMSAGRCKRNLFRPSAGHGLARRRTTGLAEACESIAPDGLCQGREQFQLPRFDVRGNGTGGAKNVTPARLAGDNAIRGVRDHLFARFNCVTRYPEAAGESLESMIAQLKERIG